jgi:hypothetical protein
VNRVEDLGSVAANVNRLGAEDDLRGALDLSTACS